MVSFGFPAKVNICVVAGQPNAIVLHTLFVTFGLLLFSCQIEDISDTIFHKLFFYYSLHRRRRFLRLSNKHELCAIIPESQLLHGV